MYTIKLSTIARLISAIHLCANYYEDLAFDCACNLLIYVINDLIIDLRVARRMTTNLFM